MKNKTIRNLTKEDISIRDYKALLVKQSASALQHAVHSLTRGRAGMAAIEKAKLFSKTTTKTKT